MLHRKFKNKDICNDRKTYILFNVVQTTIIGYKAAIFFSFFINWTRAHFQMAELGCLASISLQFIQLTLCLLNQTHKKMDKQKNFKMESKIGHTVSQEQSPWREMILKMAFSIHYQDETSCKTCPPTSASNSGTSVYDQLPFHVSSCIKGGKT